MRYLKVFECVWCYAVVEATDRPARCACCGKGKFRRLLDYVGAVIN